MIALHCVINPVTTFKYIDAETHIDEVHNALCFVLHHLHLGLDLLSSLGTHCHLRQYTVGLLRGYSQLFLLDSQLLGQLVH